MGHHSVIVIARAVFLVMAHPAWQRSVRSRRPACGHDGIFLGRHSSRQSKLRLTLALPVLTRFVTGAESELKLTLNDMRNTRVPRTVKSPTDTVSGRMQPVWCTCATMLCQHADVLTVNTPSEYQGLVFSLNVPPNKLIQRYLVHVRRHMTDIPGQMVAAPRATSKCQPLPLGVHYTYLSCCGRHMEDSV